MPLKKFAAYSKTLNNSEEWVVRAHDYDGDRVIGLENFRQLDECSLWDVFLKITEVAHKFVLHFPQYNLCLNFGKKWVGQHFG
jgi:hypothetical protein